MLIAFGWGLLASSSLLIGAVMAVLWDLPRRVIGAVMAFGVGVLLSAVSFELIQEAYVTTESTVFLVIGLALGALTFYAGNQLLNRFGARHRKRSSASPASSAQAIVLGTVLDGIPESIVLGLGIFHGGAVSAAVFVAVFISNLPEAIGSSSGLLKAGWTKKRLFLMWLGVVVVSGLAALLGYAIFRFVAPEWVTFTLAFAAGALLTMVADTMMPEAYEDTGASAGLLTTLGFGLAFLISMAG